MNRRTFIQQSVILAGTGSLLQQCVSADGHLISGQIVGADKSKGHLVRDGLKTNNTITKKMTVDVLIIGGGVSGLSAARWLQKNGQQNFLLAEMAPQPGGNATSGSNEVSAYPWGAHYIPIPNNTLDEYNNFLEECGVITGYKNGLPLINEYYLCFEPQERLYMNGYWQDGLIPQFGVHEKDIQEIKRFLAQMEVFRNAKGADGKEAFTIPLSLSSKDNLYTALDEHTMKEWMLQQNYRSEYLHWYINYCCRDDYGTRYDQTSAWAGIHYFAGRKGRAANAPAQSVITWPEGNAWLVQQLKKDLASKILTQHLAIKVTPGSEGVVVQLLDTAAQTLVEVTAEKCIMAVPQFAGVHLLQGCEERKQLLKDHFVYHPWMVANITTPVLNEHNGVGLCWDNVLYNGKGLGYVNARQQNLQQGIQKQVLTYYLPLTELPAMDERKKADARSFEEWVNIITTDLAKAHPDLASKAERIDIWVWGHGMISPAPGFIHGAAKEQMQQPVLDQIFFCHTDLSGISVFEEAFYQGIHAAKAVLTT